MDKLWIILEFMIKSSYKSNFVCRNFSYDISCCNRFLYSLIKKNILFISLSNNLRLRMWRRIYYLFLCLMIWGWGCGFSLRSHLQNFTSSFFDHLMSKLCSMDFSKFKPNYRRTDQNRTDWEVGPNQSRLRAKLHRWVTWRARGRSHDHASAISNPAQIYIKMSVKLLDKLPLP